MIRSLISLLLILLCTQITTGQGLDTLQLKTLFKEPLLAGVRPVFTGFSDDGRKIYFNWNEKHTSNTVRYEVDFAGKNLKKSMDAPTGMRSVSPDKKWVVFSQNGDLYLSDLNGGNKRLLSGMTGNETGIVWSTDSRKIAFVKEGDVYVLGIIPSYIQQLTRKSAQDPAYTIWSWAAKNQRIIVSQSDNSTQKEVFFPSYVEKFVTPGGSKRGFGEITVSEIHLVDKKQRTLFSGMHRIGARFLSKSEQYYLMDRTDLAQKKRELLVYDIMRDTLRTVFADSTKGWISGNTASFAPGTDLILLSSERDGWNHLYTVKPDGSQFKQITKGTYEIDWHAWLGDNSILYASTEVDPGERHLYAITLSNGIITRMTRDPAFREAFRLSPDKQYVVYEKTFWNQPEDLYILNLMNFKQETRLTNSIPDRFKSVNWQTPEYTRFKGRDGKTMISMTVLKPDQMKKGEKYPVIIFVHGAGSLQNVYKGWSNNYHREYLFHQYLNQQGYVVIEVDYRHSLGYGRQFREDVTNWMGKYELEDILDGLNQLQPSGYADMNRVGIYGGSYGGFMALYAVSRAPDRIHAAAALRAVTNWENYFWANPGYTWPRLGHPDKDTLHYRRSSPLSFADSLSRPVYLLHGLIDDNVGFQDAVQYVEKLIQSGNERFDLMLYPSERHSFTDPDAWYDEYRRIFNFFEKEVKNKVK